MDSSSGDITRLLAETRQGNRKANETAKVVDVSTGTVKRDWDTTGPWLHSQIAETAA